MAKGHYIPEFYLKGFTDPDVPHGQKPYVWFQNAGEERWRRRAPSNLAAESGYYVFTDDEGRECSDIEGALSRMESQAAPVIRMLATESSIDDEERGILATFAATMLLRVPAVHEQVGDLISEVAIQLSEMHRQLYAQHPEELAAFKERYRAETGRTDLDDLQPEDLDTSRYRISAEGPATVGMALSAVAECAEIIAQMGWTFLISEPLDYFVTSDHPFFMVDRTNQSRLYGDGLLCNNIEVTLPLTRNVALLAGWHSEGAKWSVPTRRGVEQVNVRSAVSAKRLLIAPKPDFPGSDKLRPGGRHTDERAE